MKTISRIFLPLAMVIPFVACNKENISKPEADGACKLNVVAVAEKFENGIESKTYIEGNDILWNEAEEMTIALIDGTNVYLEDSDGFVADGATGLFSFTISNVPVSGEYQYGGIYPASAQDGSQGGEGNQKNIKTILPATQIATAASYDPAAYILVAKPESFTEAQDTWYASFRRATALNKITLTGIDEDIVSVDITVPEGKYLAGRRYIDISTGVSAEDIYYGGTNMVSVKYADPLPYTAANVWFTSWEVEVAAGEEMTIKATTASKIYTKTFAAAGNGISFKENYFNTLTVNMADADIEDIEVAPAIPDGEYLIGAFHNGTWAVMTPENKSGYYVGNVTSVSVPVSDIACTDFYTVSGIRDNIWTVSAMDNGYSIGRDGRYVSISGQNANVSESSVSLAITKNEDGTYFIEQQNSTTNRALQYNYNNGSPRFKLYSKSSTGQYPAVVLIPWEEVSTPIINMDDSAIKVGSAESSDSRSYTLLNADYTAVSAEVQNSVDWVSVTVTDGAINWTIQENTTSEERNAVIVVSVEGGNSVEIAIEQAAAGVSLRYYVKVTEDQADWSGQYLIVYEAGSCAFDGSLTSKFEDSGNYKPVNIEGDRILSTEETDNISFTIAQISGGYSILGHSGYYIYNDSSTSNTVKGSTTETGLNTITMENNSAKIVSTTTVLRYNTSGMFRYYKSSSYTDQQAIQLYKLQ